LKKYRRIEVNAHRGRVTIVSGEWPRNIFDEVPCQNEGVSLDDRGADEAVEPDSPEGQLILLEAVRSLEQRLSAETLATIRAELVPPASTPADGLHQPSPHETEKEN
jgi:hypothetical protein